MGDMAWGRLACTNVGGCVLYDRCCRDADVVLITEYFYHEAHEVHEGKEKPFLTSGSNF